jgi:threonine aldolase
LKQTAEPFESIYVSFYKGLGNGIGGAMLLGNREFCAEARVWLRRFGGNLYSVLPYAVAAWSGFRRNCIASMDTYDAEIFDDRQQKLARVIRLLQTDSTISSIVTFDPSTPETNMVHGYLNVSYNDCIEALNKVEQSTGIRVLSRVRRCENNEDDSVFLCRFEWVMGECNSSIDDYVFVSGWNAFASALK